MYSSLFGDFDTNYWQLNVHFYAKSQERSFQQEKCWIWSKVLASHPFTRPLDGQLLEGISRFCLDRCIRQLLCLFNCLSNQLLCHPYLAKCQKLTCEHPGPVWNMWLHYFCAFGWAVCQSWHTHTHACTHTWICYIYMQCRLFSGVY